MKVRSIHLTHYRVPFRRPYVTAAGSVTHREGVLVRLETDESWSGHGESALLPHDVATLPQLLQDIERVAQATLGHDIEDIALGKTPQMDSQPLPEAASGIEIAAWDVLARSQGKPLCHALTEVPLDRVPVNALVNAVEADAAVEAATRAVADGFRTVKLKAGTADNAAAELQRIAAVRETIGLGVRLRLDANGAWTEEQARAVLAGLEDMAIEYVEQPVTTGRIGALKRLHEEFSIPLAADEDVANPEAAMRLIEMDAVDLLILKPVILGGIGPSLRIAAAADQAGIGLQRHDGRRNRHRHGSCAARGRSARSPPRRRPRHCRAAGNGPARDPSGHRKR